MYEKNLTETVRLRLSKRDMEFLGGLSEERAQSVSEVIRSIIGEYRRSLDTVKLLQDAMKLAQEKKAAEMSNGDTKTNIDN